MTIRRMRISCRIPRDKNTHSQYVILIAARKRLFYVTPTLPDLCSLLWLDEGTSGETALCNAPTVYPPSPRR